MASFSSLPAMDIDPVGFGARDSALQSQSQIDYLNAQKQQELQPLEIQQAESDIPLEIKAKQQQSQLATMDYGQKIVARTIQDARAAEAAGTPVADIARNWDQGMQQAKDAGYSAAGQYISHYQIGLAERLGDVYAPQGGGTQTAAAAREQQIDQGQVDRAVAAMPMPQIQKALANQDIAFKAWDKIRTGGKQAWDEEMANLKAQGIDPIKDGHLDSLEYSTLNYARLAKFIQNLQPIHDAMVRRAQIAGTGATPPAPAPLGTSTYVGVDTASGKPIYHNSVTGQDTIGQNPIGPKPTAAISAFQYKYNAAVRGGMSQQDALQFANGRRSLPDERIRDMALSEANRELGDATLAGATIPDPDSWVRAKAADNYRLLTQGAPGAGGGGGNPGGPNTSFPNVTPPPSIIAQLKAAGGRPLRFKNNQVWKWINGRAVRVQ